MTQEEKKKLEIIRAMAETLYPRLPYHNFPHAAEVYLVAERLAELERVNYSDKILLEVAALLHDVIYIVGVKDNEERSAEVARTLLTTIRYSAKEIERVRELILATKMPQNPKSLLEQIICDADLDNLGRDDFFEKSEKLRRELGILENDSWIENQLKFLKSHRYYTSSAKKLRDNGKRENIRKLKLVLEGLKCQKN